MDENTQSKEVYCLLIEGNPKEDNFLEQFEKEAKNCGDIRVSLIAPSEIAMEGENGALMKLFIWLLCGSFLKKVRNLKPGS